VFYLGFVGEYETEPLTFKCVEAMRKWELSFNGECKDGRSCIISDEFKAEEKLHKVEFKLTFVNQSPMFHYDMDGSATAIGRAFAPLPWSRTFFPEKKRHHQHQYQQIGRLEGSVTIDSKEFPIQCFGLRDHTSGVFDWGYYLRSITLSVPLWKSDSKGGQPDANIFLSLIEHPLAP
jgi:hypothetical protein